MPVIIRKAERIPPGNPNDYFCTDKRLASASLGVVSEIIKTPKLNILDPGSGMGIWGHQARFLWPEATIHGAEFNRERFEKEMLVGYDSMFWGDYLTNEFSQQYDLIIGNPPYGVMNGKRVRNLAEKFVRKSFDLLKPNGILVQLLQLEFLVSETRGFGLFVDRPPQLVNVCSKRPGFYPDFPNMTNSIDYAVFYWKKVETVDYETVVRFFDWRAGVPKYNRTYSVNPLAT